MEVGSEEGGGVDAVDDEFGDGPGEAEAVVGGGAAAELVDDDEGFGGGGFEDGGGLEHLGHEGGDSFELGVGGADAGEDAVEDGEFGGIAGDEAAGLGEEGDHADLSDVGRFAAHVGAGDDEEGGGVAEEGDVVGDELDVVLHLHAGVAGGFQDGVALTAGMDLGADVGGGGVDRDVGHTTGL